jgi:ATP-binding cassette subfamily C protein
MADDDLLARAAEVVAAAGSPETAGMTAPHFADPLTDAFSVAAATADGRVVAPDPEIERHLGPAEAIATASGLMISPPSPTRRWWASLPGPAVVDVSGDPAAVLPTGTRAVRIAARSRHRTAVKDLAEPPTDATMVTRDLLRTQSWLALVAWSIRSSRRSAWWLVVLAFVGGVAGLLLPLTTKALFTSAVPWGDTAKALEILAVFAVASLGAAIIFFARNLMVIRLRDISDATLSPGLLAKTLALPARFFRERSAGDVLNRVLSVEEARALVDDGVPSLILTSAFGVVNLAFLIAIDAMLGLWLTLVVAAIVATSLWLQARARNSLRLRLQTRSESDGMLLSLAASLVPIRVAGAESRALARWAEYQARTISALEVRMRRLDQGHPVQTVGPLLVNVVLVAAVVAIGPSFNADDFMPVYAAVIQLTVAMTLFSENLIRLWEVGPVLSRALPLITAEPERTADRRRPGVLTGGLSLTDVVFGYDSSAPPLLDGLSLDIKPGEFVAVVGGSGSGKTTLMRLMLGFENPWSGVVAYDGQDLAGLDVTAIRRQIGTVLQSSVPFGSTFRECICGPLQVPDDRLWQVLEDSGLAEDVRAQPAGLDAPLVIGGGSISGGQRQRLMIARALAGDPRMILLDEATSALDNVTQEIVMRTMLGMDVTRIAIAHRLSTVERADRVIVMQAGRIVEEGTPAQLKARGGHFAKLAARQEI